MFNDSDNGQTQYCKECFEKENRIKFLEKENEALRMCIKHYKRGMFKVISVATECNNTKEWEYYQK